MTIHEASGIYEGGTDIVLTLKHGYDHKGFANTVPILFKAGDHSRAEMAKRAKGFADNADEFVICEA